jgi:hypothetical protein
MPEGQELPTEKEDKLNPLELKMKMNFYDSFLHSQGRAQLQTFLLVYLTREYKKQLPDSPINYATLLDEIKNFKTPVQHNIPSESSEFESHFAEQVVLMDKNAFHSLPFTPENKSLSKDIDVFYEKINDDTLLTAILDEMIDRDIIYVEKGRFDVKTNLDSHRSFIKNYALDQNPTRSDEYNLLYKKIRELLLKVNQLHENDARLLTVNKLSRGSSENFYEKIKILEALWEKKHPGESFFPSED